MKLIPEHESPVRRIFSNAHGFPYTALKTLEEARQVPDAIVVMEGDYGGQIYLTVPAAQVRCDEPTLRALLGAIDALEWAEPEGAGLYFERAQTGTGVAGGMGGGAVTGSLWVHEDLADIGADAAIHLVLSGASPVLEMPSEAETRAAAAQGDPRALYRLGIQEDHQETSRAWLVRAASLGHTGAMLALNEVGWLEAVATSDASPRRRGLAWTRLVTVYEAGDQAPLNADRAIYWAERLCELWPSAHRALSVAHLSRKMGNKLKAMTWLILAMSGPWDDELESEVLTDATAELEGLEAESSPEEVRVARESAASWPEHGA